MNDQRAEHIISAIENAFRQRGSLTVAEVAAIIGYEKTAIYPIVKPPRFRRVGLNSHDGKRGAYVWRLMEAK